MYMDSQVTTKIFENEGLSDFPRYGAHLLKKPLVAVGQGGRGGGAGGQREQSKFICATLR